MGKHKRERVLLRKADLQTATRTSDGYCDYVGACNASCYAVTDTVPNGSPNSGTCQMQRRCLHLGTERSIVTVPERVGQPFKRHWATINKRAMIYRYIMYHVNLVEMSNFSLGSPSLLCISVHFQGLCGIKSTSTLGWEVVWCREINQKMSMKTKKKIWESLWWKRQ